MTKHLTLAAVAAMAIGLGAPAARAQQSTLIIYGNDKCPAGTVCVRAPESERYRIPQSLRSGELAPSQQPGSAARAAAAGAVNTGPASCSNVGGGGGNSCLKNIINSANAEKKAAKDANADSPLPK